MDRNTLVDILNGMLKERDFSKIAEVVPYEDRFALFMKNHEIKIDNPYLYSLVTEDIFTSEEADTLYDQIEDKEKRKILFMMLSDDKKVTVAEGMEMDGYSAARFVSSIKDVDTRYRIACGFIKKEIFSTFSLSGILGDFTGNYKFQILDEILKAYNAGEKKKVTEFEFSSLIKEFEEKDRYTVLKKLLNGKESFSHMYLAGVIKILAVEDRMDALCFILDKYQEEYKKVFYGITDILNIFSEEEFNNVLYAFLDRGILDQYEISRMLEKFDLDRNIKIIDSLIEYGKNNNRELITDYTIAKLLDRIPREEGIKVYQKYAIDTPGFGNLRIARYCQNVEDRYFYLDYLIGAVVREDFEKAFDTVDNVLFEMDKKASGEYEYPNIINMYVKKHNLDRIHLREFIKRFNYNALRFMNSKSVRAVINLPDEEFVKFMNIFNQGTMLDNNIINSICNSFLQREFRLVNKEDYTIFTQFELLLQEKNEETSIKIAELLVKVGEVVDIDKHISKLGVDFDQFVYNLMNDDKKSIDLLHDMTQEYIMKRREVFVKNKLDTVFDEIGVVKKVEKSAYKKKFIEISSEFDVRFLFQSIPSQYLTDEEKQLVENRELLERLIKFKKDHTPLEDPSEKRYLKLFESLFNKAYEYKYDPKKFEGIEGLPYSYYPVSPSVEWLLGIIVECNVPQVVDRVISDKEVYTKLIAFIQKYKMLGWDKTFEVFGPRAEVEFTEGTMASIISNFYTISSIAEAKDANLTQFIDYANCYDSMSKTYSYILGKDNYRAIAANEGKNKADMSKSERLGRVPRLIQGMYAREEITTPPIDKDYETIDGKKMNVVLGNSTNMINLSYGERTNSCLRIGGAFNNLFEFCIHDKNGFHVRFTDPDTGEFISRVSGIRNGNTIFFNELRDSENPNYDNEQIIEVLNMLSSELIEMTKDEECPIDNVVITYDYAMRNYEQLAIPTELKDYPNAFYGKRFNIPFDGKFVLLKSTSPDGGLVPYKFGADIAKTYETQRDKVVTLTNPEHAYEKVVQLHLIDNVLKGYEIDELTINTPNNVDICIAGEDWCVYKDTEGVIHQFVVEMSKHKDRALEEMRVALEQMKTMIEEQSQNKTMGV